MSFDILREWDLESFDPGLEFFPETERATSLEVVEPPAVAAAQVTANIEVPKTDEMAREAASSANQNFASDMVVNQGNHDFDLDFDVTEDMMAMWEAESAARAQEDRDDLERERAGIGRKHERFGVNDKHSSDMNNTRRAMEAISDMQQMQSNNIHSFSGSITDNGYNFNINGESFEISDDEMAQIARKKRLELEEQMAQAQAAGASQEELDSIQARLDGWTQIDQIYNSGRPITEQDRNTVLGFIESDEGMQADMFAEARALREHTNETVIDQEITAQANTFTLDLGDLNSTTPTESHAALNFTLPEEGIQSDIQLAVDFKTAVLDTSTETEAPEIGPEEEYSLTSTNNNTYSFDFMPS